MTRKLDATNNWLTLIANLSVIVGIVFLVVEISQNTRAIDNETAWARFNANVQVFGPAAYDREVLENLVEVGDRIEQGDIADFDPYSDIDFRQFANQIALRLRYYEALYLTMPSAREVLRSGLAQQFNQPGFSAAFFAYGANYDPGFWEFLQDVLAEQGSQAPEQE